MLRIRTSRDSSASRKVRSQAAEELHSTHRTCQSVFVVLRARFVLDTARLDGVHRRPYARSISSTCSAGALDDVLLISQAPERPS